jgi:hypothetical protein
MGGTELLVVVGVVGVLAVGAGCEKPEPETDPKCASAIQGMPIAIAQRATDQVKAHVEDIERYCPKDDQGAGSALVSARSFERAETERSAIAESDEKVSRRAGLVVLRSFIEHAQTARKAPERSGSRPPICAAPGEPRAGWCNTTSVHGEETFSAEWLERDTSAIELEGSMPRIALSCADVSPGAKLVRRWQSSAAEKVQTHCLMEDGKLAGFHALIQLAKHKTHVSLMSPSFLKRDPDEMVDILRNQGETIEQGNVTWSVE